MSKSLVLWAVALSLFIIAFQAFPLELRYQRDLIIAGEVWRIWTGHLVHTNYTHLALNLSGLWLLLALSYSVWTAQRLSITLLLLSSGISLFLLLMKPHLIWYVGLSGTLYGLFLLSGVRLILTKDYLIGVSLVVLVIGKALLDTFEPDANSSALIGAPVILSAHYSGLVIASILAGFDIYQHYQKFNYAA